MKWFSMASAGAILAGMVIALGACVPEAGHAALTFKGERSGDAAGPGVTCPFVSSVSATWTWAGTVGGKAVTLTAAALNSSGVPDALLINSENISWRAQGVAAGTPITPGTFTARVTENKVVHIDGIAARWSGEGEIRVSGAMRCPN
jgi:hypothetical protein